MIQIITEQIKMPPIQNRKFQKDCKNNKWFVVDKEFDSIRYKGKFEDVILACYNLNKAYYKENCNIF